MASSFWPNRRGIRRCIEEPSSYRAGTQSRRARFDYLCRGQAALHFWPRTLLWLFPAQEHQLVDRSDDAQFYVVVFKPSLIARSCRTPEYEGLKRSRSTEPSRSVLNTVLEPESFDLIRKTMDSLMQGSLDPDVLNQQGGFGRRQSSISRLSIRIRTDSMRGCITC